jgi:hypothetical protein
LLAVEVSALHKTAREQQTSKPMDAWGIALIEMIISRLRVPQKAVR